MESSSIRSRLERAVFFRGMEPAQVDRIAEMATPVQWQAGVVIFREGDPEPNPRLYIVEEGLVALQITVPGRGPVTILSVGPGDLFGWSSLFDGHPKTAVARAGSNERARTGCQAASRRMRQRRGAGLCDHAANPARRGRAA